MKGLIFNIQRFSIHDGPGIRTTVFFKGCSLRCFWCHNPEGRLPRPEIQFFPERCIACGECVSICPNHAHRLENNLHLFIRENCQTCGNCVEICPANALELIGRYMTIDEVMGTILRDRVFYDTSNGGVTLSGGEPLLQADFVQALLRRCKKDDLHTAIETSGNYPWSTLEKLLPAIDLIMMDLKLIDPIKHKAACGDSNERILANAQQLSWTNKPIIFRIPVIPTVNDSLEEIGAIVKFVKYLIELRIQQYNGKEQAVDIRLEFLPFHRLAGDKYRSLGLEYLAKNLESPSKEQMRELTAIAEIHGVEVVR